jgi:2-iminobutanoate/2-iminopropanoate deaminase
MKKLIHTEKAPKALGAYSQGTEFGNLIFSSGQIPLNASGQVVEGSIKEQTKQVLENLKAILEEAGSSLDKVLKVTVFLKELGDFEGMNEVYSKYFGESRPARSTVQAAGLPKNVKLEIDLIAFK